MDDNTFNVTKLMELVMDIISGIIGKDINLDDDAVEVSDNEASKNWRNNLNKRGLTCLGWVLKLA